MTKCNVGSCLLEFTTWQLEMGRHIFHTLPTLNMPYCPSIAPDPLLVLGSSAHHSPGKSKALHVHLHLQRLACQCRTPAAVDHCLGTGPTTDMIKESQGLQGAHGLQGSSPADAAVDRWNSMVGSDGNDRATKAA